ncbi:MAG: DUF421 domain-containing protein [Clostridiales bacterium]|nr:DUF421 domain-containing protein [Clostridiales bacterium]
MFTLFIRTVIIYFTVFIVLRLMGKRQISDMQPFDLVITLLIADVASVPVSDSAIPLLYGIIPILCLFVLHRFLAHLSLKSNGIRTLVCGKPIIVIAKGVVQESALKAANYTLGDLTEQLRIKDVFSLSQVEYGILETNGSLSVLPKAKQPEIRFVRPSALVLSDGKIMKKELNKMGYDERWLEGKLSALGIKSVKRCLFVFLEQDGMLHVQEKEFAGKPGRVHYLKAA